MVFIKRYNVNHSFFHTVDTEEKAYWLGFLAADGSIGEKNKLILRLAAVDIGHIKKFKQSLESEHNIVTSKYGKVKNPNSCIIIRSNQLIKDLAKYYIVPRKTFIVRRSHIIDQNLLRHFWRGVFDGDGSIYQLKRDNQFKLSVAGNSYIIWDFRDDILSALLIDLQIEYRKSERVYSAYCRKREFVLKILDWLYADSNFYLDRKYKKYILFKETYKSVKTPLKYLASLKQLTEDKIELGTWKAVGQKYDMDRNTVMRVYKRYLKQIA